MLLLSLLPLLPLPLFEFGPVPGGHCSAKAASRRCRPNLNAPRRSRLQILARSNMLCRPRRRQLETAKQVVKLAEPSQRHELVQVAKIATQRDEQVPAAPQKVRLGPWRSLWNVPHIKLARLLFSTRW